MENLNIGTVKQLERSKLKLVRCVYYKVTTLPENFYILEKCYASKYDGRIDLIKISEDKYYLAKDTGERTEEVELLDAKDYIEKYVFNKLM